MLKQEDWNCGIMGEVSTLGRIKVKCIPNNYQSYFTKLPYLEFT